MNGFEAHFVDLPDGRMFTWQAGSGPLLLFLHATGMCAGIYGELLTPLTERFRVVAPDARGHGRTRLPLLPALPDWQAHRADMRQLIAALGERPHILAGHSFGATTLFELAANTPDLADHVVLLDPAYLAFAEAADWRRRRDDGEPLTHPLAELALRRRADFASRAEVRAAYHGRGAFRGWPDAALDAYLDDGLVTDESGVHLACPPAWEALNYLGVSTTMAASMQAMKTPFTLLLAARDSMTSAADEATIRALHPTAPIQRFAGTGHFLPVTHPQLVLPYFPA